MCIICIEFERTRDLADARMMLAHARREPGAIDREHLDDLEAELEEVAAATQAGERASSQGSADKD